MYNVVVELPNDLFRAMEYLNTMNAWCRGYTDDKSLSLWHYAAFGENGVIYGFEDGAMAVLFSLKWVK
jgi:hypothetical protein